MPIVPAGRSSMAGPVEAAGSAGATVWVHGVPRSLTGFFRRLIINRGGRPPDRPCSPSGANAGSGPRPKARRRNDPAAGRKFGCEDEAPADSSEGVRLQ